MCGVLVPKRAQHSRGGGGMAALVAFALLAFQKWLNRNWFEAAFVATGTYGLARQKLYDPRRAQWLVFTLGFLVTMYYVFPPICHWLVTELVKAVHDLSSGAAKDPQRASLLIVLAIVACARKLLTVLNAMLRDQREHRPAAG